MLRLTVIFLAILASQAKAQFVFENDYPTGSTFSGHQLMLINLEVSGERYVNINRGAKTITLYHLNHSLDKTISLSGLQIGINSGTLDDILYISENLFNLDTSLEFVYIKDSAVPWQCRLWVYNESGNILFYDTASMPIRVNVPLQQYPIYNSSQGTKMILSYPNGHAKVWGLAGTLTTAIQAANQSLMNGYGMVSSPAPNPAVESTRIDYSIPPGAIRGEIVFFDAKGQEIRRFMVDNSFTNLMISTTDIPAGTYYYQLQVAGESTSSKKLVVVK
jgi:hypothetical protein